jgi:hypothetical protein
MMSLRVVLRAATHPEEGLAPRPAYSALASALVTASAPASAGEPESALAVPPLPLLVEGPPARPPTGTGKTCRLHAPRSVPNAQASAICFMLRT